MILLDVCDQAADPVVRSRCLATLYNLAIGREELKEAYVDALLFVHSLISPFTTVTHEILCV